MPSEITSEITQVLQAIRSGNGRASEELLPLVYNELRRLAAARMGGFTGVVPEFVCPPPPHSLTTFQISGKWNAHL